MAETHCNPRRRNLSQPPKPRSDRWCRVTNERCRLVVASGTAVGQMQVLVEVEPLILEVPCLGRSARRGSRLWRQDMTSQTGQKYLLMSHHLLVEEDDGQ
jgi:hypothetical protein